VLSFSLGQWQQHAQSFCTAPVSGMRCTCPLRSLTGSVWQEGKFGCRWRTSKEVVAGWGQFTCGAKGCDQTQALESFEVPFTYVEANTQKQALVKASNPSISHAFFTLHDTHNLGY